MICKKVRNMPESVFMAQKCMEFAEKFTSQCMCDSVSESGQITYNSSLHSFSVPHIHDSWELKLFIGSNPLQVPEKKIGLKLPGFIVVAPGATHSSTIIDINTENQMLALTQESGCFALSYLSKENCILVLEQTQLVALSTLILATPEKVCATIYSSIQEADNEFTKFYAVNLLRFFLSAIAKVLVSRESNPPSISLREADVVTKAIQYITIYYYMPTLTVRDVAKHVGLTPEYLSVLFKKQKKPAIRKQIIKIRLEKAKELLLSGRYIVKEISCLTGWNDQLYFSKCFRKYYGVSPRNV